MQDQNIPLDEAFELDCGAQVTVPSIVVDPLRSAAYAEVASAAEALDTVALSRDREAHPEWFRGPAESLKQIYALLDVIGWARSVPPIAVRLDLGKDYCWALMRALQGAAEFADDDEGACEPSKGGYPLGRSTPVARLPDRGRRGALTPPRRLFFVDWIGMKTKLRCRRRCLGIQLCSFGCACRAR